VPHGSRRYGAGHARESALGVTAAGTGAYAAGYVQSGGHGQVWWRGVRRV